jgi:glycerol-3-phosphate acyltransferase PlsY
VVLMFLPWFYVVITCYIVGSLPSAYLAGRYLRHADIRLLGDQNAGALNAWVQLGRPIGAAVAVIDMAKGAAAVLIARGLMGGEGAIMLGGVAAVAGHNWPIFLGLRGGRGAATALGVLASFLPWATIPLALAASIPLALTRSTTVAFAFTYVPLPMVTWYLYGSLTLVTYSMALPGLVGFTHWMGVRRLAHEQAAAGPQT